MGLLFFTMDDCVNCANQEIFMENEGIKYDTVDLSKTPEKAIEYGIMSTPVTILLDGEEEIDRAYGFDRDKVEEFANKTIGWRV